MKYKSCTRILLITKYINYCSWGESEGSGHPVYRRNLLRFFYKYKIQAAIWIRKVKVMKWQPSAYRKENNRKWSIHHHKRWIQDIINSHSKHFSSIPIEVWSVAKAIKHLFDLLFVFWFIYAIPESTVEHMTLTLGSDRSLSTSTSPWCIRTLKEQGIKAANHIMADLIFEKGTLDGTAAVKMAGFRYLFT